MWMIVKLADTGDRLLSRLETYDIYFSVVNTSIVNVLKTMREVDIRGSFESDDEVGSTFKQLDILTSTLSVFVDDPAQVIDKLLNSVSEDGNDSN